MSRRRYMPYLFTTKDIIYIDRSSFVGRRIRQLANSWNARSKLHAICPSYPTRRNEKNQGVGRIAHRHGSVSLVSKKRLCRRQSNRSWYNWNASFAVTWNPTKKKLTVQPSTKNQNPTNVFMLYISNRQNGCTKENKKVCTGQTYNWTRRC